MSEEREKKELKRLGLVSELTREYRRRSDAANADAAGSPFLLLMSRHAATVATTGYMGLDGVAHTISWMSR